MWTILQLTVICGIYKRQDFCQLRSWTCHRSSAQKLSTAPLNPISETNRLAPTSADPLDEAPFHRQVLHAQNHHVDRAWQGLIRDEVGAAAASVPAGRVSTVLNLVKR